MTRLLLEKPNFSKFKLDFKGSGLFILSDLIVKMNNKSFIFDLRIKDSKIEPLFTITMLIKNKQKFDLDIQYLDSKGEFIESINIIGIEFLKINNFNEIINSTFNSENSVDNINVSYSYEKIAYHGYSIIEGEHDFLESYLDEDKDEILERITPLKKSSDRPEGFEKILRRPVANLYDTYDRHYRSKYEEYLKKRYDDELPF